MSRFLCNISESDQRFAMPFSLRIVSKVKRFNRPSTTTAISKENRGWVSHFHDTRAGDSFAQWLRIAKVPPFPVTIYIPKLRFPTFYVTLCIDATCVDPDVHLYAPTFESDPSNPIRISRACARQKWPISTDRCCSRAKSTLSHTPMLSLNCFGKALTYRKRGLKSRERSSHGRRITGLRQSRTRDSFSFLCVSLILDTPNVPESFFIW